MFVYKLYTSIYFTNAPNTILPIQNILTHCLNTSKLCFFNDSFLLHITHPTTQPAAAAAALLLSLLLLLLRPSSDRQTLYILNTVFQYLLLKKMISSHSLQEMIQFQCPTLN